jgi:hypothetical protein
MMKLLVAAVFCLGAQPPERQSSFDVVAALTRGKVESERYHVKVPFETFTSLIQIPAKVGARECRMVVDTGAPMVITPELAKELDAKLLGVYATNDSAGNRQDREFVLLPTIEIAGVRYSDLAAIVVDLQALPEFRERSIDGLIGGNLLRHGALAIDYGAKVIEFAPDMATLGVKDGLEIPIEYSLQASSPATSSIAPARSRASPSTAARARVRSARRRRAGACVGSSISRSAAPRSPTWWSRARRRTKRPSAIASSSARASRSTGRRRNFASRIQSCSAAPR